MTRQDPRFRGSDWLVLYYQGEMAKNHSIAVIGIRQSTARGHAHCAAIENGAAITPFPVGRRPLRHRFAMRNALMAAWSKEIIVIEAPVKSGALMTAERAMNIGKRVCTVETSSAAESKKPFDKIADRLLQKSMDRCVRGIIIASASK